MSSLEATAATRAARLGKTIDELLVHDGDLRKSNYPTADCFRPHEVEQYARGDMPEARMEHAKACQPCAGLLVAAQSWERPLDVFLDEVRRSQRATPTQDNVRDPTIDALCAAGPIVALGLGAAAFVVSKGDAIMSISLGPLGWTPVVFSVVAALVAGAAIPLGYLGAKSLGFQVSFTRFGGAAIAGLFVLVFGGCSGYALWNVASNYQRVQTAEELAVGVVASRIENGSSEVDPVAVAASTASLEGSIVAEPRKDAAAEVPSSGGPTRTVSEALDMYWDQGERQSLGTVYFGSMARLPDGNVAVKTSTRVIKVNVSPSKLSQIKNNEPVFAVVPAKGQEASKVFSVRALAMKAAGLTRPAR